MAKFLGEITGYVYCKPQLYDNKMLQKFELNKSIFTLFSTLFQLIWQDTDFCVNFLSCA